MIQEKLREFADSVCETGEMTGADVKQVIELTLETGLVTREEADVVIALDRAVKRADEAAEEAWGELFTTLLVDYAVWSARPSGYVDGKTARWLVTAVNACGGPSENARRAVARMVQEAQRVDEALLVFVMRRGVMRLRDVVDAEPDEEAAGRKPGKPASNAA